MPESGNLFEGIPAELPQEISETLGGGAGGTVRIERIVSRGHRSPEDFWYDQEEEEWVVLLRGSATLRFEDPDRGTRHLVPGDWLRIPARVRHRVEATAGDEDTIWLAVFHG